MTTKEDYWESGRLKPPQSSISSRRLTLTQNASLLGQDTDLESFLFETSRQSLAIVQTGLRKISNRCFYCGRSVSEADVDHFIPHSLYPRDLIHNMVLADPGCNRS